MISFRNFCKSIAKYTKKYPFSTTIPSDKVKTIPNLRDFLTDTFGRYHNYLRISLTERCNLRCSYCMPEEGVNLTEKDKLLTREELNKLVSLFVKAGVVKIRLTGGEPTVRKDLVEIVQDIRNFKEIKHIAMTTNGIVLKHKISKLKEAGLDSLNISLDTLVPAKFTFITRRLGFEAVIESIRLALEYKFKSVKVNCVLTRGFNDDEILDFIEFTRDKDIYLRFIEYMPFDGNRIE